MQSFLILALFAVIISFSAMQYSKYDPTSKQDFELEISNNAAGNLVGYITSLNKYVLQNYSTLHVNTANNVGHLEQITLINTPQIRQYDQKNTNYIFDYRTVTFNYTLPNSSPSVLPYLFAITTWNNLSSSVKGNFTKLSMYNVMGSANQLFSLNIYEGNGTFWTVPILVSQMNCNITQYFNQVPISDTGLSTLSTFSTFFNNACTELQNSGFSLGKYVFMQPVYLLDNR